jgi:hypothetical protein
MISISRVSLNGFAETVRALTRAIRAVRNRKSAFSRGQEKRGGQTTNKVEVTSRHGNRRAKFRGESDEEGSIFHSH